jgi:serine protease Do
MAQGSGFVISEDGYVVTNNHVIDGAQKISVSFDANTKYDAELVGTDARTDVAVIRIKAEKDKKFAFVKFAPKEPRVGDWVLAVGNPFGLGGTVTAGIVSALGRDIGSGPYDYMQIDAAVNRGNSGGPTFNLEGEVVGVNTAIYSPSGGSVGIAFAIPSATASKISNQIKEKGSVTRGWLGVKIQSIDEELAKSFGLTDAHGALINEVTAGGPAAAAGLKTQDAILSINGAKVNDSSDLARKVAEYSPDTTVDVRVMRGNKEETIKVKLGKFPASTEVAKLEEPSTQQGVPGSLGLTFSTAKAAKGGVQVTDVDPDSDAATKGLKSGDVVTEVNGQQVASANDVESEVKKAGDQKREIVRLTVRSDNQTRIVPVQINKKG